MNETREACVHHWVIETPNGITSNGTCKLCGSERDFYNTPEYMREGHDWMQKRDNIRRLESVVVPKAKA